MEIPFLKDLAVIFGLSIVVLLVCHRLRIPTIVGFLLTGALAGPSGLELIHAYEEVEVLAEIGVVLLLFTIGIEFSLESLLRIRKSILVGGTLQVLLTFLAGFRAGKFEIRDVPPGKYVVSLQSAIHPSLFKRLEVKADEDVHVTFSLDPPCSVAGRVVANESGQPIPGASVRVLGSLLKETTTGHLEETALAKASTVSVRPAVRRRSLERTRCS